MYNYEAHANNCFRDHPSSDVEMLANQMRCRRSGAELGGKGVLVRGPSLGWGKGLSCRWGFEADPLRRKRDAQTLWAGRGRLQPGGVSRDPLEDSV